MKKGLLILIIILLVSCSKTIENKTTLPEATSINLITGMNCNQNYDDPLEKMGNPNIFLKTNL